MWDEGQVGGGIRDEKGEREGEEGREREWGGTDITIAIHGRYIHTYPCMTLSHSGHTNM